MFHGGFESLNQALIEVLDINELKKYNHVTIKSNG